MKSVKQVVSAVCCVMHGAQPNAVLADHRGTPRAADLRAVSMLVWRDLFEPAQRPCYTAIGKAFGRDRRNVARGLRRIRDRGLPSAHDRELIDAILR